jgi:polar amino acid transport system substrate-binding protein
MPAKPLLHRENQWCGNKNYRAMKKALIVVLIVVLRGGAWAAASSSGNAPPLRVVVYVDPPFVARTSTGFGGFAIELWETIAAAKGWKIEYVEAKTLPELIDMVSEGQAQVGVTDLFITSSRLKKIDFSQPYFESGLQVMVNSNRRAGLADLFSGLYAWGHLRIFAIAFGVMIVATLVLAIFDRRLDPEFPRDWLSGLAESFYHVMSTSAAGSSSHKRLIAGPIGHLLAGIFLASGVIAIAYLTSSMTSVMTVDKIRGQVVSFQDLAGKKVGSIAGSTGEAYCESAGFDTQTFDGLQGAVGALTKRRVDAIVYDSPSLRYYSKQHPDLQLNEVGAVFEPQQYGFALPLNSPIRRAIDEELLKLSEDGYTNSLNRKYFADTR